MTIDLDPPQNSMDVSPEDSSPTSKRDEEFPEQNQTESPKPTQSERNSSSDEFLLLHPTNLIQELGAIFSLLFFLMLWRIDAFLLFNSHFLGGSHADSGLYLWLFRLNLNHFADLGWFQAPAFYPYTKALAWSDNFILPAWFMKPLDFIGIEWNILYNLSIVGAQFLNGYFTYRLAFLLSGNLLHSLCAGVIFTALAFFTINLGHPQLQFAFFFPAAMIVLFHFLRRPSLITSIGYGFLVGLAFLTTVYYALFLILLPPLFFALIKALRPTTLYPATIGRFVLGSILGLVPALPFIAPYLAVKDLFGARGLYEAYAFRAQPWSYLATGPLSLLYGWTSKLSHPEAHLFPGALLLLVALLGSIFRLSQARPLQLRAVLVFLFFVAACALPELALHWESASYLWGLAAALAQIFCFGFFLSFLRTLGKLEASLGFTIITNRVLIASFLGLALGFFFVSQGPLVREGFVPSFFQILYYLVPGFDAMRAIGRAGILVLFSFSLLFVFSLPVLFGKNRLLNIWGPLVLTLLILLENYVHPYALEPRDGPPLVLSEVTKKAKENDVAVIIPFTANLDGHGKVKSWRDYAWHNVNYMNWGLDYDVPLMNGYSGHRTDIMHELPRKMSGFPDQRSLNTIAYYPGLRYVIVNTKLIADRTPEEIILESQKYLDEIEHVSSDGEGYLLFRVTPKTRIRDGYYVRVPSSPRKYLSFEVLREYAPEPEESRLSVYESDHFEGREIVTLPIVSNGEWQEFVFELPEPRNPAQPFRITFASSKKETLHIRNIELVNPDTFFGAE